MITKKGKSVVEVFKGEDTAISEIYKGDDLVWQKVKDYSVTVKGMLDQTSTMDPALMYTGPLGKDGTPETNVVSWIKANSHRYVGMYDVEQGMFLKQLDDDNSELYTDGTDASEDITGVNGKDVFMKMPTFWFRGERVNSKNYNLYITKEEPTDGNTWVKWDGNTLIGVYKAFCDISGNNDNGNLYSRSNVNPTANVRQENFKNKARNRSNGDDHFMIVTYEAHRVMALLYILYYGNMDSQAVVGSGTYAKKITGQTNVDGMNDTVAENTKSINFWGLENWWGDLSEFIDNMHNESYKAPYVNVSIDDYEGEMLSTKKIYSTTTARTINTLELGDELDVTPTAYTTQRGVYYCDSYTAGTSAESIYTRSFYENSASGGIFNLNSNDLNSFSSSISTRLQYHGRVTIIDEFPPNTNGYKYVDMGDAGIWATCNVGASKPEEAGLYFQWGDTEGYTREQVEDGEKVFDWEHYKWCNGTSSTLTKYNVNSWSGSRDNKTVLESSDDAATQIMGGDWRIPSPDDYEKLFSLCSQEAVYADDTTTVIGMMLTLNTDSSKQLYFLYFGYCEDDIIKTTNRLYCWHNSINTGNCATAGAIVNGGKDALRPGLYERILGIQIRGFIPKS